MSYGTQVGGGTGGRTGKVRMSLNSMAISGMCPTPTASTGGPCKNLKPGGQVTLQTAVAMWPTPRAQDAKHMAATPKELMRETRHDLLHVRVAREDALMSMWPTPQAHDAQKGYAQRMDRASTKAGCRNLNDQVLVAERQASGHLNPDWVSLMMGFPPHWTKLTTRGKTDGKPEHQE